MTSPPTVNSVDAKIHAIMTEIETVPKHGFNTFSNYKYVTERDAIDAVRRGCVKHGLVVYPSLTEQDTGYFPDKGGWSTVVMEYRIVDIKTGHERVVVFPGSAKDQHDKSIFKSLTGSMKYFNLKTFLIGGEDDAEADSPLASATPKASAARAIRGLDTGTFTDDHHRPDTSPITPDNGGDIHVFKPGELYLGPVLHYRLPGERRPGLIAIATDRGELQVSFPKWGIPPGLEGIGEDDVIGAKVSISFTEKPNPKDAASPYRNLADFTRVVSS